LTLDPGWKKIRIRDKHPGSATLVATFLPSLGFRLFAGQVEALLGVGGEVHSNDKKYRVMVCFFLISVFEVVDVVLFPVFEVVHVVLFPVFEVVDVVLFPVFEAVDVVLFPDFEVVDVVLFPVFEVVGVVPYF
jgi:hypothetical protein